MTGYITTETTTITYGKKGRVTKQVVVTETAPRPEPCTTEVEFPKLAWPRGLKRAKDWNDPPFPYGASVLPCGGGSLQSTDEYPPTFNLHPQSPLLEELQYENDAMTHGYL